MGAFILAMFYCIYNIGYYKSKVNSLCDSKEERDTLLQVHKNEIENITNKYKKIIQQLVTANSEPTDDSSYFTTRKPEELN